VVKVDMLNSASPSSSATASPSGAARNNGSRGIAPSNSPKASAASSNGVAPPQGPVKTDSNLEVIVGPNREPSLLASASQRPTLGPGDEIFPVIPYGNPTGCATVSPIATISIDNVLTRSSTRIPLSTITGMFSILPSPSPFASPSASSSASPLLRPVYNANSFPGMPGAVRFRSSSPSISPAVIAALVSALASASPNVPRLANSSANANASASSPGMIAGISIELFLTVFVFCIAKYLLELRKRSKVGVEPNPALTALAVTAATVTGGDPAAARPSGNRNAAVGGRRRSLRKKIQYKSKSKSAKQRGGSTKLNKCVEALVKVTLEKGTLDLVNAITQIGKALD